jgi:hypothetical protein
VAYWPVSFFIYSLKNDALNYFLPVRYQVSEAISSGHWPFWSPYFNLGYPLHGDMQSGVWNPVVQIFSLFGPYTLRTLHYETLLYIFLSGIGMFYLLKHFAINKSVCLLIGVSYMLCGYNSDSTQFLNWISAASFLPFVILFSFRLINEDTWKAPLLAGLFLYLFFVTAYPADFIILFYLLVSFFIWQLVQTKSYKKQRLPVFLKKLLVMSLVFILLSLPAILSYIQSLPLTERGSGASYKLAMSNPLHPILFISYITPLPVWKASFASVTDPLERNSYFGLIVFAFFIASFFFKTNDKWLRFCKWGFFISAIFSLGEIGGLRIVTYYILPLMDTFRHPANAKIFTIFFACCIAAIAMQQLRFQLNKKWLRYSSFIIALILIALFIWSCLENVNLFERTNFFNGKNFSDGLKDFLDKSSFSDLLLLNIILQVPFLLILYIFSTLKINFKILMYAGLLNVVLHTMLFTPFTVVKNSHVNYIQTLLDKNAANDYTINLNSSVQENSGDGFDLFDEIGARNMYNKKIGRIDYRITPSNLKSQNMFWNDNPRLRNLLIRYPLLYKADTVLTMSDSNKVFSLIDKKVILVNERTGPGSLHSSSGSYNAVVKTFTPNRLDVVITSEEPGIYSLFQNYYPNWKLYVDGKAAPIIRCNISFMGFKLNRGTHSVSFQYKAPAIKIAFLISLISLLTILLLINKNLPLNSK